MRGRGPLALAVVGVIVVLALFFFLFLRPRQSRLAEVNEAIEDERTRTVQLTSERDRLRELQANAPQLQAALQEVRELVPEDDNVPNFIFQVQEAANAAGLRFVRIAPQVPEPPAVGAPLAQITIDIGADGGYFAVQDFVRRLYRLDRALRIDLLTMAPEEGGTAPAGGGGGGVILDLAATARIFFELPPGAVPGAAPAPGTTPAPGTSPTPAASPSPTPGQAASPGTEGG